MPSRPSFIIRNRTTKEPVLRELCWASDKRGAELILQRLENMLDLSEVYVDTSECDEILRDTSDD